MGNGNSSPLSIRRRHHHHGFSSNNGTERYHQFDRPQRPVRFRASAEKSASGSVSSRSSSNGNYISPNCRFGMYTSRSTMSSGSTRKHHSVLLNGWNLAKKAAASLLSGSTSSFGSSHSSSSAADDSSTKRRSTASTSTVSSARDLSSSRSHDSHISFGVRQSRSRNLFPSPDPNANELDYVHESRSQDSLTLFSNMYSIEEELQRGGYAYNSDRVNEQDLTNNNTTINGWSHRSAESPPRRLPRLLSRFAQIGHNNNNAKSMNSSKRASLSSSGHSSSAGSTGSASSFNLSANLNKLRIRSGEPKPRVHSTAAKSHNAATAIRQSQSQHSFAPSETFDWGSSFASRPDLIHSSTTELLRALGRYVHENSRVRHFEPSQLVVWLRSIDRALMLQGWQDVAFLNPANLVFVFHLVKEQLAKEYEEIESVGELQSLVRTCLYVAYSYMGNEISYPLKPFISQNEDRHKFWDRCVQLINDHSVDMLRLNTQTDFFIDTFGELRLYADMDKC